MDIRAEGFWTSAQVAFFDIRDFTLAPHRTEKRSSLLCTGYIKMPRNVNVGPESVRWKGGSLLPLVLSTTGGMAHECTVLYKHLADHLACKRKTHYSLVMTWLRCRISFALLRSAIRALRGSQSSSTALAPVDIPLMTSESFIH